MEATTIAFDVTALKVANHLVMATQPPVTITAGTDFSLVAVAEDSLGNVDTSFNGLLTVTDNAGALEVPLTVPAVNGMATFSGLTLTKAVPADSLYVTADSLTAATSNTFDVKATLATQLLILGPAGNVTAGSSFGVLAVAADPFGNADATYNGNVTVVLSSGTLHGTLTEQAVNGVAAFSDLSINKAGTGYTLTAADGSLASGTSGSFNVTPAPASKVVFTMEPSSTAGDNFFTVVPAVQVSIEDDYDNVVTSDASSVIVALGTNPSEGTLHGTLTRQAVNGAATFSDLSITMPANCYTESATKGYTLTATDGSLSPGTSDPFSVTASTPGLYDPASSIFRLKNSLGGGTADEKFPFGKPGAGWIPIAGDWDGNGTYTIGLYDPATSTFRLKNSNTGGKADEVFVFGKPDAGWIPIVGDWVHSGIDSIGLYDPATSTFHLKNSHTGGKADELFVFGKPVPTGFPLRVTGMAMERTPSASTTPLPLPSV